MTKNNIAKTQAGISFYGFIAAFSIYFCTYAFRKPFAAGTYSDYLFAGFDYKIILVKAQLVGYTISKFIGIRLVSGVSRKNRPRLIVGFILFAELALLGFGMVDPPYQVLFIFLNGLPLGMIWGLVFAYLEGRRITEMLAIGQSLSFIVSSGVVKGVGKYLMDVHHVSEYWMPFFTGLLFSIPLFLFLLILNKIPKPDEKDIELRVERVPMNAKARINYLRSIVLGLGLLVFVAILLTIYRDIRDNFAVEILSEIGNYDQPSNLINSEIYITLGTFLMMGCVFFIKDNRKAVFAILSMMVLGITMIGASTYIYVHFHINPYLWFTLVGLGLYLTYVPYHSILYDRIIALMKKKSNAGYLIYITDAFGYMGTALVMFYKNFLSFELGNWLGFFIQLSYIVTGVGVVMLIGTIIYFYFKKPDAIVSES